MPKTRRSYPPEFRRRMVELVRSGRSPEGGTSWKQAAPSPCDGGEQRDDIMRGTRTYCFASAFLPRSRLLLPNRP